MYKLLPKLLPLKKKKKKKRKKKKRKKERKKKGRRKYSLVQKQLTFSLKNRFDAPKENQMHPSHTI